MRTRWDGNVAVEWQGAAGIIDIENGGGKWRRRGKAEKKNNDGQAARQEEVVAQSKYTQNKMGGTMGSRGCMGVGTGEVHRREGRVERGQIESQLVSRGQGRWHNTAFTC